MLLQIYGLGTDIGDGVPSVLLFFDKTRSAQCPFIYACIVIMALLPAA